MVGRPSKRTPEREARLLDALRAGNTRRAACHYAAITEVTFETWCKRYFDFFDAVQKAEADAEVRMVAQIAQAAQTGTWQAAAWWLERRRGEDFARRDRVEVTIRQQAERLAAELGLDAADLISEAERIVAGTGA